MITPAHWNFISYKLYRNLVYYFHLKSFIPFHIFFFLIKKNLVVVSWVSIISSCISIVISIHFLTELFVKICLKIKEDIFERLLKLLVKKMSLIISLFVLFNRTQDSDRNTGY